MEKITSKYWYMLLLKGVIMIVLAVLIFMSPVTAILTYGIWIGLGFLIAGIVRIVQGFQAKGVLENWGWMAFEGVMDIILGFVLVANPEILAIIFPFLIGFWAAFYGGMLIVDGFSGTGNAFLKIIAGILIVVIAFHIMFNPIELGIAITIWIGIVLLIAGIYNVVASFSLK